MRLTQITMLAAAVLLGSAVTSHAQTVVQPGASITVAWDAPPGTDAGTAPTGYRFETFRETAAGVTITTTDVPLSPTQSTLPSTVLPETGAFLLAVRAFNATGVSDRSNAVPFVRAGVPPMPGNLRVVLAP